MPSPFEDFALPVDAPAKFHPINPATSRRILRKVEDGAPPDDEPCWISFLSWHSQAAQDWRNGRDDKLRRLGRAYTSAEEYEDFGGQLAAVTVDWRLIAPSGRLLEVRCDFDRARELWNGLEFRWLRFQAIAFLADDANFLPPSWRTS